MPDPKLSKLELQIMEALWTRGEVSIREIQESSGKSPGRPMEPSPITINRMEEKKIVRRRRRLETSTSLRRSSPEMQLN